MLYYCQTGTYNNNNNNNEYGAQYWEYSTTTRTTISDDDYTNNCLNKIRTVSYAFVYLLLCSVDIRNNHVVTTIAKIIIIINFSRKINNTKMSPTFSSHPCGKCADPWIFSLDALNVFQSIYKPLYIIR